MFKTTKKTVVQCGVLALIIAGMVMFAGLASAQESDTKNDPSLTPWNDPDDPYVILLNRDDPTVNDWNARNDKLDPTRKPGPIDLQRYENGFPFGGFPTFLNAPFAMRPEDLKAGDIDLAIVGSTTDMNSVLGTSNAANVLRGHLLTSASNFTARGDGKQTREADIMPIGQYTRS